MPRTARAISKTGYYHVVANGNGKWILFEDDLDRRTFLDLLSSRAERWGITVVAWCLMDTHVHLLIADFDGTLSKVMQSLMTVYAREYNQRTGRSGHLFEERFWSKCIEDDAQLLEAVRYIHNNPSNAGISTTAGYVWSSYSEYIFGRGICDTKMVLEMLGGRDGFVRFCSAREKSLYNPYEGHKVPRLHEVELAKSVLGGEDPGKVGTMAESDRISAIRDLVGAGLNVSQVARLTGMGRWTISKAAGVAG